MPQESILTGLNNLTIITTFLSPSPVSPSTRRLPVFIPISEEAAIRDEYR